MSLWAIVPVKPLRRGKSRLAGVLTEEERTSLNYSMLTKTLKLLSAVPEIGQILLISRDTAALALARDYNARTLQEDGSSNMNVVLQRATVIAQLYAAQSVLVVPANLPLLDKESLQHFIQLGNRPPVVVIAPDRRLDGTNAMLVHPAGLIDYQYGPGAYQKHVTQALRYGVRVEVCNMPSFSLDLDLPEDLEALKQSEAMGTQIGLHGGFDG